MRSGRLRGRSPKENYTTLVGIISQLQKSEAVGPEEIRALEMIMNEFWKNMEDAERRAVVLASVEELIPSEE